MSDSRQTPSTVNLGKKGEEQAVSALKDMGMAIVAQNYRCKAGEVDIIAQDGDAIVFIEVKAWNTYEIDDLMYGINQKKQDKIIKTAKFFLSQNRQYSMMSIRFDVVFVKENAIRHLASAFTESVL